MSLRSAGLRRCELLALVGILVEPRLQRLLADLDDDVLVGELALTTEPRLGTHIERLVHAVVLLVGDLRQRVEPLLDVDVARGAREVSSARVADPSAALLGDLEDREALARLDRQ